MSTASQPQESPMERVLAAREAGQIEIARYDDAELGCESAYPFLQFDGWEPLDSQRAGGAPGY